MMTNKDIAGWFRRLADVMELHAENPFKIRSYRNAYVTLRKWDRPLASMSDDDLSAIPGIGQAISAKIRELTGTGDLSTFRKYADKTPEGVVDMLSIPGVGPKKVRALWKDLGIESVGELAYACHENRLIQLEGFGEKTQADILKKLEFFLLSRDKWLFPDAMRIASGWLSRLQSWGPGSPMSVTGELRRNCPVITSIDLLWAPPEGWVPSQDPGFSPMTGQWTGWTAESEGDARVRIWTSEARDFGRRLWETTGSDAYIRDFHFPVEVTGMEESSFLRDAGLPDHRPAWRETRQGAEDAAQRIGTCLELRDIRGVIHTHTRWSDGVNSLEEMAEACRVKGFDYLVVTDHSQSAFYANGLQPERVLAQREAISQLNGRMAPFRVFHGIESDIRYTGELDYPDELLAGFEVVIASIHSQLTMTEEKSMERLLTAIRHPATKILGHPTGRLLLARKGYPVDHRRILEACAEHNVAIELNANPQRLDLDWSWLPLAMDLGVRVAIDPDAHSIAGIEDIRYGVLQAEKAGLRKDNCLNTMDLKAFSAWVSG